MHDERFAIYMDNAPLSPTCSTDDLRANSISSGNFTPIQVSPRGSSSNLSEMWVPGSPRSEKVVKICKNCNYSFRVRVKQNASDFCGKDCETCFTVFYNMTSPSSKKERTASEIRESIFHFQQRRLNEDHHFDAVQPPPPPPVPAAAPLPLIIETALVGHEAEILMALEQQTSPSRLNSPDKKKPKAVKSTPTEPKRSLLSGLMFFSAPRPVRPNLQAFF